MKTMTYNGLRNIIRKAPPALAVLFLLLPGCSYVMDSIEGAITERASFSIDVQTSGSDVIISWDESSFGGSFAGYEIYVTKEPNDEYVGYELVASRYFNGTGSYANLDLTTTHSFTYDPPLTSGTIYFYRVGIIIWDENDEQKRINEYGTPAYFYNNALIYNQHTEIDEISGAAKVVIP